VKTNISRRDFLKSTTLASVGFWVASGLTPKVSASPNERIALAGFGVGNVGGASLGEAARFGDVVAVCDVDHPTLNWVGGHVYPKSKSYTDYRRLLDEMDKSIDAVTVGTADHMHAPISLMAMRMKKHVFVQKPLARTVYESRLMGTVAKEMGVCTQMGNQGSADDGLRRNAAEIKAGLHGEFKEIHIWLSQTGPRPATIRTMQAYEEQVRKENPEEAEELIAEMMKKKEEAFERVDWDLWLGIAPEREFFPGIYHPSVWRGWWDFGGGTIGDWACHILNGYQKGLDISAPSSIVARTSGHDFDAFPRSSEVVFEYPDMLQRRGFKLVWYDGGRHPSREFYEENGLSYPEKMPEGGEVVIKYDDRRKENVTVPEPRYAPKYPDADGNIADPQDISIRNVYEWITAIKENNPELCFSNFTDQAGPLTEAASLGKVAIWTASKPNEWGEKILWDSENMTVTNLADLETPGVAEQVKPVYREGHVLD